MYQLQYHHLIQQLLLQRMLLFEDDVAIFNKLFKSWCKLFCSSGAVKIIYHWMCFLNTERFLKKSSYSLLPCWIPVATIPKFDLPQTLHRINPLVIFFWISINMYDSTIQFNIFLTIFVVCGCYIYTLFKAVSNFHMTSVFGNHPTSSQWIVNHDIKFSAQVSHDCNGILIWLWSNMIWYHYNTNNH